VKIEVDKRAVGGALIGVFVATTLLLVLILVAQHSFVALLIPLQLTRLGIVVAGILLALAGDAMSQPIVAPGVEKHKIAFTSLV
jgi:hypothetical protein